MELLKKLNLKKKSSEPSLDSQKPKKKLSKQQIFTIVAVSLLVLTHIAVILAIALSFRYYGIYPSLFGSIVGIVICFLIIIDILFFVGFNHQDLALKIISIALAFFIFVGGTAGTYLIAKANGIVDNVLDANASKYETFSGVFVSYGKNYQFEKIEDLDGKRVGMLAETNNGISYIAKDILDSAKIDYAPIEIYKTNAELITALIDGDVDAIAITSAYRNIYSLERDENSPFASYLDYFVDFNPFEKELKVDTGKKVKNLNTDPFNVLLIGYSRTDIGSPVGLADSIILASINPQTYTVSMMSIARDSFVPIACYGGEYDKINSGRSTSRACFIQTVEDFINTGNTGERIDIDYYMELDYLGLVQIVNAIGGITINNPVEFTLDGIYVPAGENVFADGQMALQFCRERHHMPNGDFDRQQHQKEVIIEIAKKFINSGDITLALNAMNAASDWMSTDLTLNQLTTIFNLLLNTKNRTSLSTFDLVDFQTLRMTGSGGLLYYSYSMHLPLWVYLLYQGSFDESIGHMNEVLGNYSTINQDRNIEYSCMKPYDRPLFYSLNYEDKFMFTPDPMPSYWIDLEGMTFSEAVAWANSKGVSITLGETITAVDPRYVPELEGKIFEQSVRYGSLISDYKTCTVTMMGSGDVNLDDYYVPDFVGGDISRVISWANKHDITVTGNDGITSGRIVATQTPTKGTPIGEVEKIRVTLKEPEKYTVTFNPNGGSTCENITVTQGSTYGTLPSPTKEGKIFAGWYTGDNGTGVQITSSSDVTITSNITLYAKWNDVATITLIDNSGDGSGSITSLDSLPTPTCSGKIFIGWFTAAAGGKQVSDVSSYTSATTLYAQWHTHNYSIDIPAIEATCESEGYTAGKKCDCGEVDPSNTPTSTGYKTEGCTPAVTYPYDEPCSPDASCTGYVDGETMSCTRTFTSETESTCACTVTPSET